ncbi:MAG: hypothetical protein CMM52_05050 [Rhodospirillaceae bacterium]|nr:hypothetical protein [Rhodospirillaceae bacterium]|tara:strand:+ start:2071 stop:3042 length:972 start_codon:yes stop_codon:yes gene_type:complete
MFFVSTISIDPTQKTQIGIAVPSNGLAKMFQKLLGGLFSKQEESETFTAASMIDQIGKALQAEGINDIVRLIEDGTDYYLDRHGTYKDLESTINRFNNEKRPAKDGLFETVSLIVEHQDEFFKPLIQIDIKRRHEVGEHPITVTVCGLFKELTNDAPTAYNVRSLMDPIFNSQEEYSSYVENSQRRFNDFNSNFEKQLRKYIEVDDIKTDNMQYIVRPFDAVKDKPKLGECSEGPPIFHGYWGFLESMNYTLNWSTLAHENEIHISDCNLVDETGRPLAIVGSIGFTAGVSDIFDPGTPFDIATGTWPERTGMSAYSSLVYCN